MRSGNQHWPALVKGNRVYVPLTVDRKVMSSVMNTHRFEGIRYEFVPGGEIVPYLAPHESRRLFGGAEGPVHSHTHEQLRRGRRRDGPCVRTPAGARHTRTRQPMPIRTSRSAATTSSANDHGDAAPGSAAPLARMLQFGDSMFPIGGFSFSGGLESAIQKRRGDRRGHARTRTRAPRSSRRRAATASRLIAAHRAAAAGDVDALVRIDERVYARKLSDETRTMSVRMGKKFTEMGARGDRRAAACRRGASASTPAPRPGAIRWRWRSTSPRRACRRARRSSCTSTAWRP